MHKNSVAVLGASGYVGRELLEILARHPNVTIEFTSSQSEREINGHRALPLEEAQKHLGDVELVLSCLPHGVSRPAVEEARRAGARAVDLSADLRLSPAAVYGLTEVFRPRVPEAAIVANPGCYPTAALLALLPFAKAGLLDTSRPVVIDAASGVSGAGRSPKRELLFAEVAEDFRAYSVGNEHRHLPEITEHLKPFAGEVDLVFTPHLLPVKRGILATLHLPLKQVLDRSAAEELLLETYRGEPFIRVVRNGIPSLKDVVYRNLAALGVAPVKHVARPMLTVISAIDNLVKGAAGQAVQNMNLMLGLEETEGLRC
ncbi:MAG: N-acetyl-gamma-glutamyl-phosphate reductase [Gemmatimonadales bacterium]|nr:N-acetyl-gamma-glutamyl-phosphate reductase [bacterium HR33]GIW52069.1 MAG: N-acetyl-gamma-glutamyl-phosphate reductase [Gemmatimonadales bacterium]